MVDRGKNGPVHFQPRTLHILRPLLCLAQAEYETRDLVPVFVVL